jgi:hypothetical protein
LAESNPLGSLQNGSNNNSKDSTDKHNSNQTSNTSRVNLSRSEELKYLKSIDKSLQELLKNSTSTSQASYNRDKPRRDDYTSSNSRGRMSGRSSGSYSGRRNMGSFGDEFEKAMWESLLGSDFKKQIKQSLTGFADLLGTEIEDIPGELGKQLGQTAMSALKNSKKFKDSFDKFANFKDQAISNMGDRFNRKVAEYAKAQSVDGKAPKWYQEFRARQDQRAQAAKDAQKSQIDPRAELQRDRDNQSEQTLGSIDLSLKDFQSVLSSIDDHILDIRDILTREVKPSDISGRDLSREQSRQAAREQAEEQRQAVEKQRRRALESSSRSQTDDNEPELDTSKYENMSADDIQQYIDGFDNIKDLIPDELKNKALSAIKDLLPEGLLDSLGGLFGKGAASAAGEAAGSMAGEAAAGAAASTLGSAAAEAGATAGAGALAGEGAAGAAAAAGAIAEGGGALTAALGTAAAALGPIAVVAGVVVGGLWLVDKAFDNLAETVEPLAEGLSSLKDAVSHSSKSYTENNKKYGELAKQRIEADIETYIKEPFNILKDAAQELYNAWDNSIRTINQTQGYSKEDLNKLIGNYATRLRSEGLSAVVSSADITTNLKQVLDAGLSGDVATEFAYEATKLSAAVPTQDWFGYASTYASVAAQQIEAGKSQSEAIAYASQQLESFASNVLYASRQISGGFSTGLKNAEDLFSKAVKISNAAHTNNQTEISGVLTAVSAKVGAVAPDLASSIIDAVYSAATGGNSSELVALRSLAGINASNTEFLQQFARNPQSIFTNLFNKLGDMQHMSDDNYMEVAEGLSKIFGISQDALSQVDFKSLASAISQMNVNNNSLSENMKLLASGESTTTVEQEKMAQINQYMIDNGLAYVMDNEAARAIQEHMWDEQLAREMQQSTYAVELRGSAIDLLTGIKNTVFNIFNLVGLNIPKAASVIKNVVEAVQQPSELRAMLEKGAVGTNQKALQNLLTTGKDLKLTSSLLTVMDKTSSLLGNYQSMQSASTKSLSVALSSAVRSSLSQNVSTRYNWNTVGKSFYNSMSNAISSSQHTPASSLSSNYDPEAAKNAQTAARLDRMISTMDKFVEEGKSYEEWKSTAKQYGIADFSSALDDAGYEETNLQDIFETQQSVQSVQEAIRRNKREEQFWDNMEAYTLQFIDLVQNVTNKWLEDIYNANQKWYNDWVNYWIKHTQYSAAYDHSSVLKVQQKEKSKSQDAVYALAEALTKNANDLLDPTVQTNAILAQILIVVNAIMQQNDKATEKAGSSLPDTLSALAMGLTNK